MNLATPQWKNMEGDVVDEGNAFGCIVIHELTHPEMYIVMDEVGGDTNMKGDENHGGGLLVCAKGMTPQQRQVQKIKPSSCLD